MKQLLCYVGDFATGFIENERNLVELCIFRSACLVETVSKSNPPPQFGVNRVLGSTPAPVSLLRGGGNRFIELGLDGGGFAAPGLPTDASHYVRLIPSAV